MKLDRKFTWSPYTSTIHSKALSKMALMKKLAGTKWGANMKILAQVYTTTVRSHMEYAFNAWPSAARTNLVQLTKAQTAGLRIIPDGMKTTPISEVERAAGLLSLEERKNSCAKAKRWRGFLHTHYVPSLKLPLNTDSRDQTTWSKRLCRHTGSPYLHATNHWKCSKSMRTGKQKLQPSF